VRSSAKCTDKGSLNYAGRCCHRVNKSEIKTPSGCSGRVSSQPSSTRRRALHMRQRPFPWNFSLGDVFRHPSKKNPEQSKRCGSAELSQVCRKDLLKHRDKKYVALRSHQEEERGIRLTPSTTSSVAKPRNCTETHHTSWWKGPTGIDTTVGGYAHGSGSRPNKIYQDPARHQRRLKPETNLSK